MKLHHYKQWKTTTLGLIIILSSIASVFVKEILWQDASIGIAVGLMLVFSPDTILDKITNILKVCILFLASSCMSEKQLAKTCAEKFPIKDSTIIIQTIDTSYLYIKGDSIKVPFLVQGEVKYKDTICPTIKCPQVTKTKEKIVYQENTALSTYLSKVNAELYEQIDAYEKENAQLLKDKKELQGFKNKVFTLFFIIIGSIIVYAIIKLKF